MPNHALSRLYPCALSKIMKQASFSCVLIQQVDIGYMYVRRTLYVMYVCKYIVFAVKAFIFKSRLVHLLTR